MKRKSLLFLLLMAMLAPLAMNGQRTSAIDENIICSSRVLTDAESINQAIIDGNRAAGEYELVTASQSDWSGNYVLALNSTNSTIPAFTGTINGGVYNTTSNTTDYVNCGGLTNLTQTNNLISNLSGSNGYEAAILTIAPVTASGYTSYYTIQINGGDYLGSISSSTGGLVTNSSANNASYYWNISYDSNSSSMYLYSAATSSNNRIRYFIEDDNGTYYGGFYNNENLYYSGSSFNYYSVSFYKETTTSDNYVWVETTTITPNEEYLIGFQSGNNVYLAVNYAASESNHYYTSANNATYYGYTAQATVDGNGYVTGVSGYATDLRYCTWKFSTSSGGTIQSGYQTAYYLNTYSSTGYDDLYPTSSTSNGTNWVYSNGRLYRTISNTNRYAEYYYVSNGPHMQMTSTNPSSANIKLYTKQLVETGYAVNAGTMSNGSIQFSINGGYDWYDNLSNVPAGETVVISVQPETGYVSGTPTVTPASGTAPTVSGSGNNYSFVMPESDVTVNVTFNCTTPADPTFSVATGTYTSVQNVTISCATAGATIYYTTDGSTPTNNSTQYTSAITINSTTTLKAIAYIGTCTSNVTSATYTMDLPTYTVTCATGLTGGSITANPTTAVEGTTITITATPESGNFLGTITATDANNNTVAVTVNGNTGSFTMPASNVTVTATFTQGFHVTLNQTSNGTISANQTTNLHPGDIVTLTATPDNDCIFLAWYVFKDGNPRAVISVINDEFFYMPSSDVTVQAVFVTEEEHEQTVGGGSNTDNNLPTNVYYGYSLTQQIYTAAEIGYNGRITAIAFKATAQISDPRTLDIYMRHTDKTAFSSTTDWEVMGSGALVYQGSVNFANNAWTTITLDTPFEYDGTSNLNICVVDNTGSYENGSRAFSTYGTSAYRALYIRNDDNSYSSVVGYSNDLANQDGYTSTSNNQIVFTIKTKGSAESLTISPDVINDFSYVEGQGPSQTHKLDIVGVDLENNITLTASTNFEISLTEDGAYASTVTVPRETGSKGRGVTTWDFEDGVQGWTTVDADNDGKSWERLTPASFGSGSTATGHDGSQGWFGSSSWVSGTGALTPNNWLISPEETLGGSFSMWARGRDANWPEEHFGIFVSTTSNTDVSSFTLLGEWTLQSGLWKQYSVDLSAFAGQTGYIAVRHFNSTDVFAIDVDDFVLDTDGTITIEMPVTITPATVFVRMKANLNRGTYNGTLTASAGSGTNVNGSVSLSGEVIAPSYTVTLSANPGEGGSVAGAGTYTDGTSVTVSVIAQRPYQFINWTENGTVVSPDASYTFTVTGDRNLVANFGFIKHITGYDNDGGYNLIASPIGDVAPDDVTNMTTAKFDLYRFNASAAPLEWENYKQHHFGLVVGRGYLYAHNTDVDLVFMGSAYNNSENRVSVPLDAFDNHEFDGWNLVGNPFAVDAHIVTSEGHTLNFFTLNESASNEYIAVTNPSVEAMEGVFVYAEAEKDTIIFVKGDVPEAKSSQLALNVNSSRNLVDRAIVRFDECRQLPKFQLNRNSTKVYIPMEGKDYAVVRGEEMGELPVNFKAEENGHYSLNLSNENVEFAYLHLIDNMTGNEVDLLQTPSYSFEAKTTDYESRFKLVYATGNNSNSDNFAYYSNGSFVINNDGAAELQVIDVMGRIMKSESINGCANVSVNGATGVYMLRLVNGDNVKVQKVVVK